MVDEVWKDIVGYEGIYEVSSFGQVRTKEGKCTYSKLHGIRKWKQRIIKQKIPKNINHGGKRVTLYKDGKSKDYLVHRLVACSFLCKELSTKMTVNHKDGDWKNNNIENLEFLSLADNIRHGFQTGLYSKCKRITLIDGLAATQFPSLSMCDEFLGRYVGYTKGCLKQNKEFLISIHGVKFMYSLP